MVAVTLRSLVRALAVVSVASGGSAAADGKFTHSAEIKVNPTLTDRSRPVAKKDAPQAPATAGEIMKVQGLIGPILDEQIGLLTGLIKDTPDSNVEEKADYYFRLGEIYAKQHRFHRLKSIELEIAGDPKQKNAIAEHKALGKTALKNAIRTYMAFTDNPIYASAPRIDTALFYFAYTLQNADPPYLKESRAAYDKLLKNYPGSKYVAEAHLAFGEYHFEARQLAEAESRYRQVLKFPQSSVYRYAQYKLGWVDFNLRKFADALQAFNDVVQATRNDADKAVLHRAAKNDFVRAYAEIGKADKALPAFKRVSGGDGIAMLATLADLYRDQGQSEKAIYVYRQLMTERPTHKDVCMWEHSVARTMLTVGTGDDKVKEIESLVKLYASLRDKKALPKAEAIECRDAASEMSGQLARAYHQEGAKTKNTQLLGYAGRLYRAYLGAFKDAPDYGETQYFHAELAWLYAEGETNQRLALDKWQAAARAFTGVLEGGKMSPKLVQVSADAAMLAWMKALQVNPKIQQQPVDDKEYEKVAVAKPLPEIETQLLGAYDLYLKYVKDPKDGEVVDVMFHKANLLRRFDHHDKAIPIFEMIVAKYPDHEASEWAAQLTFDSYSRLHQYDKMLAFADGLDKKWRKAHPEVDKTATELGRQAIAKGAEGQEMEAKKTGDISKYVDCGDKYLQVYNLDPLSEHADKYLYNGGVCYEGGRSLSAAIGMYKKLQELFPKSKLTARSVARLGGVYASVAFYKEAAEMYELFGTTFGGEKEAQGAISDAVQFRKGIGDDSKAIADTLKFIQMFGKQNPAAAATAFYSLTGIYEKQGDLDKLAAHLRAYLDRYGATGGADRRVIASAKLGQTLWQSACPVATVDGACVRMVRVASIGRKVKPKQTGIPKRCGDEDTAEITIVPRDERRVKAAMTAFANAIAEYEKADKAGKITGDTRGALYHYAASRFGKVERDYEAYLALAIPNGLVFDPRSPAIAEQSKRRFETWFTAKSAKGTDLRKQYEQIIELKDGAVSIASAARLGALMQNFSAQLFRAEIPVDQRTGPYAEDASTAYCETLEKVGEPLQKVAENAYEACLSTSTRLGWFSEWSRACERELGQLMPTTYPKAFELRRNPDGVAAIVDTEPAPAL